ncbi:MAG: ParB/RepB/Spo0J family partition protein [Planctomycetes bacterium]|nr:ParB/RepB/Spo0J family partition protein [Planctomycetota bacterium]
MITQLVSKPLSFFKPDPNQPRKHFDEAALRALGESLKIRQNDPVQSKPDGIMIDGERRLRAAKLVGLEKLDVILTDAALTDSQINVIRLTSFFHREDLSAYEKYLACADLMAANPSWQMKDLAETLKLDASMVTRILSPSKCIEPWVMAFKAGQVGVSDVYAASKLPEADQAGLLALKLSGATRDQLEQASRKARTTAAPAVKLSRISCQLPGGVTVAVSGKEVSLDEAIESLSEVLKAAKKARDEGLTAKSWTSAMKDKAKAAG